MLLFTSLIRELIGPLLHDLNEQNYLSAYTLINKSLNKYGQENRVETNPNIPFTEKVGVQTWPRSEGDNVLGSICPPVFTNRLMLAHANDRSN